MYRKLTNQISENPMSLTFRQIRYFIAAAETSQVSQAAKNLNISQSAVTMAIKSLEEQLEVNLFERHSNGISLTYDGNQFFNHARNIVAAVDEAMRVPSRAHEKVTGTIRLVMSYTVAGYFLPAHLARFQRNFPNVEVVMEEADRTELEEGLVAGAYDLAVMLTSNLVNQEDIAYDTLLRSRRRLWVCSDHKFLSQSSVSLQDVSREPYIMLTVDEASNTAQRYWNRTPYRPDIRFRTSSVESVRSMVANGMGLTILSDMVYRPWSLEGRRIEVLGLTDAVPTMDVGLAWKSQSPRSPAVEAFSEFLHMALGAAEQRPLV